MASETPVTVDDLDEIISSVGEEFFEGRDSEEEQPEPEDEIEEAPDEEDETDEDPDDVEDPDEPDEGDEDNLEDDEDESDEEDEEDSEDDEESDEDSLELADDATVRLSDGTEVSGKDLREGFMRQADYTRKTQEVAEQKQKLTDTYRKMEQWYEDRANNPNSWIAEIAYSQEDPAASIAGAIRETGNATVLLGQTLRHLVESGEIADELVEALNLTSVAEQAKEQSVHHEVQSLKQQLEQRDQRAAEDAQLAQIENQLNQQWTSIVTSNGLEFSTPQEEYQEKINLLQFARDNQITSLDVAWAARAYLTGQQADPQKTGSKKQTPKKRQQAESAVKKRKTSAMSRKPTGSGTTAVSQSGGASNIVADAASQAMAELGLDAD